MNLSSSLHAAPVFKEGYQAQQRSEEGITFPKILLPPSANQSSLAALVQKISSNSVWLEEELHRHSAILFREFSVKTAEDFSAVSRAFGWEPVAYSGMAPRREVLNGIYTANEGPMENEIWLHHEMAQSETFPSKIIFFCEIEPTKGGETYIALSHKAVEEIQMQFPAFMRNLEKRGALFTCRLTAEDDHSSVIGKGWHTLFNTTDEAEAEKRAAKIPKGRIEWQPDKSAKIVVGPLKVTESFREDGRKVWFRNITSETARAPITYGDGSEMPLEAVNGCARILQELVVRIPWRQGDVLVLDNLAAMHGRPAAEPPRRILVSLHK